MDFLQVMDKSVKMLEKGIICFISLLSDRPPLPSCMQRSITKRFEKFSLDGVKVIQHVYGNFRMKSSFQFA